MKVNSLVQRTTQVANEITRDVQIDLKTKQEVVKTIERVKEIPKLVDVVLDKNIEEIVIRDIQVPVEKEFKIELKTLI